MRINDQGRLVVNFRTKARFRGLFVESHSGGTIKRTGKIISHISLSYFVLLVGLIFQNALLSSLHVIHGDECGSSRPDLQPDPSEERAHLQPTSAAMDIHL